MSANFDQYRGDYQAIAAGQTAAKIVGQYGKGAAGDILDRLIIIPASVSPGAVTIQDGAGAAITVLPGGSNSLTELKPIFVPIKARSVNDAWKITTGSNVSVIAIGRFQ